MKINKLIDETLMKKLPIPVQLLSEGKKVKHLARFGECTKFQTSHHFLEPYHKPISRMFIPIKQTKNEK